MSALKTKRLIIRPLKSTDYQVWKRAILNLNPAKNRWDKGPEDFFDLKLSHFKKIVKGRGKNYFEFGIFLKNGEYIGNASIMDVSRGVFQSAYLGYSIFNTHWQQGYAKEAVSKIIEHGFKELNLHRIEAGIDPHNKRSIKLAKSLGMRKEGLKKNALYLKGKWTSITMYALTCEDLGLSYEFSYYK